MSEAGGTRHGLENAWLEVSSASTGTFLCAATAADGSYTGWSEVRDTVCRARGLVRSGYGWGGRF